MRAPAATFLILAALLVLPFVDLVSADRVPLVRDLLAFFLPFKAFLSQSLRRGDFPLWNPWIFLGTPFLASLHTGIFYPPSVLLLLPFPLGFNVFLLFHYLVALSGAFLFLRSRGLSTLAVSLGSLAFVVGGYLVSMLNVTNHLQGAAWTPVIIYIWTRHVERPMRLDLPLLTVLLAVQALGGSPETLLLELVVLGSWTVWRRLPDLRGIARAAFELGGSGALAVMLAAAQLLPTAELAATSLRGSAMSFGQVSFWSMEPISLLQLLFPHSASLAGPGEQNSLGQVFERLAPWISSLYLGLIPLCLAIVGLVRGRERRFWGVILVLGVLLALGRHAPLLPLLYEWVPSIIGKFRYPEKFWFLVHLAAFVLCAEGAERIAARDSVSERLASVVAVTFLVIAGAVLWLHAIRPMDLLHLVSVLRGTAVPLITLTGLATDLVFKSQRLVMVLFAFLAILALRRLGWIREGLAAALLVALTVADLGGAHYRLNLSVSWSDLESRPFLTPVDELRERRLRLFHYQATSSPRWGEWGRPISGLEESFRIMRNTDDLREFALEGWPTLPGNTGMIYGVGNILGGDSFDRSDIEQLRDVLAIIPRELAIRVLRTYSVGFLIGRTPLEEESLRLVKEGGEYLVYRVAEPLPHAYLARRLTPVATQFDAFNAMIAPAFRPGEDAAVERLPDGWRDASSAGEARIVHYGNDRIEVDVRTGETALLVLNDSWFPGWEARLDGAPVGMLRTNALVRGVVVPAGEHRVVFEYRPRALRLGAGISLSAAIILVVWLALQGRRRPASRTP